MSGHRAWDSVPRVMGAREGLKQGSSEIKLAFKLLFSL